MRMRGLLCKHTLMCINLSVQYMFAPSLKQTLDVSMTALSSVYTLNTSCYHYFSPLLAMCTQTSSVLCVCFITIQTAGEAAEATLLFRQLLLCGMLKVGRVHANVLQRIPLHVSSRAFYCCPTAAGSWLCWESFFHDYAALP